MKTKNNRFNDDFQMTKSKLRLVLIWNSPTHVALVASYRLPGRNVSLSLHVANIDPCGTPFSNMNPCGTPWIRTSRVTRASWAFVRHSFHIVRNIWNKQRPDVTYSIGNNLETNVIFSFRTIPCNWMETPYPTLLLFVWCDLIFIIAPYCPYFGPL